MDILNFMKHKKRVDGDYKPAFYEEPLTSGNENLLYNFYLGELSDINGRFIKDIWMWNNDELEYTHDYIQWLFPLSEKSNYYYSAPILDDELTRLFKESGAIQKNMLKSLEVMLRFYGFELLTGPVHVFKAENFDNRKPQWLYRNSHNHLRITRILKSLMISGLEEYALAFFSALLDIYESKDGALIGETTYSYWKSAVGNL